MTICETRLHFGLVHGGAHGGWCWERVTAALEDRGYAATTMDLPCDDEEAGATEYAKVVVESLSEVLAPVVLVGHSLGGLTIPLVANLRPVQRLIFLCAFIPDPGRSFQQQRQDEPEMMLPYKGGREGLRRRFFHRCDPNDADWAMKRLRYQATKPFDEITPLTKWPDVPISYIVCAEDRACNPIWARRAARERLGVEPIEIPGSDHSPFFSLPSELTQILISEAEAGAS